MARSKETALFEAGHYYTSHGPTDWSLKGIRHMRGMLRDQDRTMLLVDNYHTIDSVPEIERAQMPIEDFHFEPDFTVFEADLLPKAMELLEKLCSLPRKKRAKTQNGSQQYFCSGFPITKPNGQPACVLLDLALIEQKYEMGFRRITHVLPYFYKGEQINLLRLVEKITLKDLEIKVVLFDENDLCEEIFWVSRS